MYKIKACFVGQTVRSTGDRQSKGFLNLCNYQMNYCLQFQHNADGPGVVLQVVKSVFLNFQDSNQFSQWGLYSMTEATNWKGGLHCAIGLLDINQTPSAPEESV